MSGFIFEYREINIFKGKGFWGQQADLEGLFKMLNSYDIIVRVIVVLYHSSSGLYYRLVSCF